MPSQFSLALLNYESTQEKYPPGAIHASTPRSGTGAGFNFGPSFYGLNLPYLEQSGLANQPFVLVAGPLPMLRCPGSAGPEAEIRSGTLTYAPFAHYAGIAGAVDPVTLRETRLYDDGILGR